MWIWTSLVLLATILVSGLSFPHPDKEYKIPEVNTGDRSQYYVLHNDGTFKYGFDTGDGAFESVKSHTLGNRAGEFGYIDEDGNSIRLEYEAGEGGFVARGDHLPKPSPELAQALAAVVRKSGPFIDPLAGAGGDKSYGFKFQSEDHSRNEQADQDGTVTGSYSFVDEDGILRSFTYRAGKGIGFVIEGDGLTQETSGQSSSTRRGSNQRQVQTPRRASNHQNVQTTQTRTVSNLRNTQPHTSSVARLNKIKTSNVRRTQTPSRPTGANFRQSSQSPSSSIRSGNRGDASYAFNYNAGDHSRTEKSDSNLNVAGSYSFIADDGEERTLNYNAGSGTGFTAQGAHLPVAPSVPDFGNRLSSDNNRGYNYQASNLQSNNQNIRNKVSANNQQRTRSSVTHSSHANTAGSNIFSAARPRVVDAQTSIRSSGAVQPVRRNFEEANIRSSNSPNGGYSFSYKTSSHSRSESGDGSNNVNGKFDFISDDDQQKRTIDYKAGSDTGFIAKGEHIPTGPEVPGSPSGQPTGDLQRVKTQEFIDPLAGSPKDRSYGFEFDSESYSRSETADEDGNVVGTYTVVDDDGLKITYQFRAGKGIGFETEEISRIQGPKPIRPTPYSGPLAFDEAPAFDVPGTPNFPSPGQSNYVHPHPIASGGGVSTSFKTGIQTDLKKQIHNFRLPSPATFKHSGSVGANVNTAAREGQLTNLSNNKFIQTKSSTTNSRGHTSRLPSTAARGQHNSLSNNRFAQTKSSLATNHGHTSSITSSGLRGQHNALSNNRFAQTKLSSATNVGHTSRGTSLATRGQHNALSNNRFAQTKSSLANNHGHTSSVTSSGSRGQHNALSNNRFAQTKLSSATNVGHTSRGTSSASRGGQHSAVSNNRFAQTKSSSFGQTSRVPSRSAFSRGSTSSKVRSSSSNPSHSHQVFPGFTLHSYAPSPDAEKFGYVLKFD